MPDDSLVDAAQTAILADRFEVDTIPGIATLQPLSERVVVLRFAGRENGGDAHRTFTVAMPPSAAVDLVRTIIASYTAAVPTDAFGRPQ